VILINETTQFFGSVIRMNAFNFTLGVIQYLMCWKKKSNKVMLVINSSCSSDHSNLMQLFDICIHNLKFELSQQFYRELKLKFNFLLIELFDTKSCALPRASARGKSSTTNQPALAEKP
jgi:hypothetical protein